MEGKKGKANSEIFETLGDFTSKENWDKFFTLRGTGDTFEWYAEWPELRDPIISQLQSSSASDGSADVQILVPGCGSSRVSEYLYDAGFRRTTNIDFSKVVVSDMLRRYVRSKPEMRWRVMDMTDLQRGEARPERLNRHPGGTLQKGAAWALARAQATGERPV
ncbi:hypothetical protein BHM03_00014161 [Ensete ventricosum]|nr:hypothetical protein BHM03_00014161 [Ensete ventricosum]